MYPTTVPSHRKTPPSRDGRITRRRAYARAAAAAVLGLGGLYFVSRDEATQPNDCVVGIDLSASIVANPGLLDRYQEWAHGVLRECADSGATNLSVFAITNVTGTDTVRPVTFTLDTSRDGNPANRRTEVQEWVETDARDQVERLIDDVGAGRGGTDLLSATSLALERFDPDAEKHRVVLLTDGLNTQSPADTVHADLSETGIETIIDELEADGSYLVDLDGARVEVYGAGIGEVAASMSPQRLAGVRRLWERYIGANGAHLATYERGYDPPSERDEQ